MQKMADTITHHEALIYAMVTMSAVDRKMTDQELARIGDIVSNVPIFEDFDSNKLVASAEACGEILSADGGLDAVLSEIGSAIPSSLAETAYALALEVAAADMNVRPEEVRFLELLGEQLSLNKLVTAAIERGVKARLATI